MVRTFSCWLVPLFTLAGFAAAAPAAAPATAPATQPAADITALIRQLGDDDFHVRLAASGKLVALGKEALPALLEARKSPDAEVQARVEEILAELNRPAVPVDESPVPQAAPGTVGMQSCSTTASIGRKTLNVTQPGRTILIEVTPVSIYMLRVD